MPAYKEGVWDGIVRLNKGNCVPTGLFEQIRHEITNETGLRFVYESRIRAVQFDEDEGSSRDFQNQALEETIKRARRGAGSIVRMMTGTGKTYFMGHYFKRLRGRGVFIVDREDLARQSVKDMESVLGEEVGMIGGGVFNPKRITVAIINTLQLNRKDPAVLKVVQGVDTLAIDELHVMFNDRTWEVIAAYHPLVCVGLTATLDLEEPHLRLPAYALCGGLAYDYSYQQAVQEGYLTPGIVYGLDFERSIDGADFLETENSLELHKDIYENMIVRDEGRNDYIAELAEALWRYGHTVVILGLREEHLDELQARFRNVQAWTFSGATEKSTRRAILAGLKNGTLRLVVASVGTFSRGISVDPLDVIIDASSGNNPPESVQRAGRGARLCEGKKRFAFVDVGDKQPRGEKNRFAEATRARRKALERKGYPLSKVSAAGVEAKILAARIHADLIADRAVSVTGALRDG